MVALVVSTLGLQIAGSAVALDRRADDRREREAAEALLVAEREHRAFVRGIATKVYDHVQPVLQIDQYVFGGKARAYLLVDDVLVRGGAHSAVAARGRELAARTPPATLAKVTATLVAALEKLTATLAMIDGLPSLGAVDDRASFARYVRAYFPVRTALSTGVIDYRLAVGAVFSDRDVPPRPTRAAALDGDTKPVSKGSYLLTVGESCMRLATRLTLPPAGTDIAALRKIQAANLVALRDGVRLLVGVKPPAKDKALVQRSVVEPLMRFIRTSEAGVPLLDAIERGDQAEVDRQVDVLTASEAQGRRAGRGLRAYGSLLCEAAFLGNS